MRKLINFLLMVVMSFWASLILYKGFDEADYYLIPFLMFTIAFESFLQLFGKKPDDETY